jgi:SpoIID/LytB domain protein
MSMPYRRSRSFRAAPRMLLVMALLTSLTAGPVGLSAAAAAEEDTTVTFTGAGWGHGVGLSQYGAYGMAREGASYEQILSHFFTGTEIGVLGQGDLDAAEPLWVNLEYDRSDLGLAVVASAYASDPDATPVPVTVIRNPGDASEERWDLDPGGRLEITWDGDSTCTPVLYAPGGAEIDPAPGPGPCNLDLEWDGWIDEPTRLVEIEGCTLANWNTAPTSYPPCRYGRGTMHLRLGPGGMDLSVELDIDDYILGISEMPYYWGLSSNGGYEALAAQAVAARSYARELQIYRGTPGDNSCARWCHVRDDTTDQRYVGWGHGGLGQTEWIQAATETAGEVLVHPDAPSNGVVRAYYSSSSGGATENIEDVWSGWDSREYYSSVDDHWSLDPAINGNASWTKTVAAATVAAKVGLDEIISIQVTARNTSGSAHTVAFTGVSGGDVVTVTKTSSWVKSTFGLKSIYFDVGLEEPPPPFVDIVGSVHYDAIAAIWERGITYGCNPPSNDRYCPTGSMTRGEMAAFLVRALDLPASGEDAFVDDGDSIFQDDINRLAAAGITRGCNPPDNDRYCPDQSVTREQMAAFLVRAFTYTDGGEGDRFVDDDDSIFEADIDRLATAGVTYGCNPPDNDRYCPTDPVRRDEMASFLDRALTGAGA